MDALEPRTVLLVGALAIGVAFGLLARASAFCFRSALIETARGGDKPRLRAYLAALAPAVLGTQALAFAGVVDLGGGLYLGTVLGWGGAIVGGLMFGVGMILARGCGARHLVLAAGGNLRAWIVLALMAVVAYMTLRGILAIPRTALGDAATADVGSQGLATLLGTATGVAPEAAGLGVAVVAAAGLLVLALRGAGRERARAGVVAGLAIGLLVPAAWYLTGNLAFDEFEPAPVQSITYVAPLAESLQYLMTYTGAAADFGIALVGGTLVGALAFVLARRDFRLEGFEAPGQMLRYGAGAALMGAGGVLALGCTIGQGLSGLSTLSLGSLLSVASIVAGGWLALAVEQHTVRRAGLQPAE